MYVCQVDLKAHTTFIQKVRVYAAKIVPNDLLIVPWGWAVAEQSLNNEQNVGLRWVDIQEGGTPGLRALMGHICPNRLEVKPNTSAGLLCKVTVAGQKAVEMRGKPHPSKGKGKGPAKVEAAAEKPKATKEDKDKEKEQKAKKDAADEAADAKAEKTEPPAKRAKKF